MAIYISLGPTRRELVTWALPYPHSLQGLAQVKQDSTSSSSLPPPSHQIPKIGQAVTARKPSRPGCPLPRPPGRSLLHRYGLPGLYKHPGSSLKRESNGDVCLGFRCTPSRTFFSCIVSSHAYLLLPTMCSNPLPQTCT